MLVGLGSQDGPQNLPKIDEKKSWAPMATPRPPKTHPRPSQDPPKTENRPQIDPKSIQNPPNIDPTSTQHLRRIYMQKLLEIKPLSTKDASIQRYKRQGQSDIRGFGPTCYSGPPKFRTRVDEGAGGSGRSPLNYFLRTPERDRGDEMTDIEVLS